MTSSSLYVSFFGLRERPFNLVPDPEFLFWSEAHRKAYTVLEYGILSHAPITLITGEIGAGKTTLIQHLLDAGDPDLTVGLVSNAQGGRGEVLGWVLGALGVQTPEGAAYDARFAALQDFIIAEYAAGRRVALIFDEAQNLSPEGIEELRLITNINAGKNELVQLVLVGQPELRDMIRAPGMRQIAQRVSAAFHLPCMSAETVPEYISHRLRHAGGTGEEFTPRAARRIADVSGGVPRLVNQLADMAMLYSWSNNARLVDTDSVEATLADNLFIWNDTDEEKDEGQSSPGAAGHHGSGSSSGSEEER